MKKFITTKINKQQWRITVPNINSNLFRKSPSRESDDKTSKRSSGFYDFTDAQQNFDQNKTIYIESTSSSTSSEEFEDARTMSDKGNDTDGEVYQDVDPIGTKIISKNIDENNSQYQYDVPRISFKFFGEDRIYQNGGSKENTPSDINLKQETDEEYDKLPSTNSSLKQDDTDLKTDLPYDSNSSLKQDDAPIETNDEIPLDSSSINQDDAAIEINDELSLDSSSLKQDDAVIKSDGCDNLPPSHPSEKFVSHTEIFVRSLETIPSTLLKSAGSDPNIAIRSHSDDEDNFYQVPRPLKVTKRLSQSLKEFDTENSESPAILEVSNESSIEHISASQILTETNSKSTSKLPKLKKPRLLKRQKWDSFKIKFNNLLQEQASKQRVGAFNDKDKITLNLEEMYKNSKSKCKKVFENTSKMFKKKVDNEAVSEPVLRKVKASDIEYKLNYSESSDGDLNDTNASEESKFSSKDVLNDSNASKASTDDSRKEDFDFGGINNAFKKRVYSQEGQNGYEDLRRYVKQGGDFCKELSQILQERAEAETQYAKSLSKLSTKLSRACRDNVGSLNEAWKAVALELETKAEAHRLLGVALLEETAKPLKNLTETQHRLRKQSEIQVDKAAKLLSEWRASEGKGKKNSHSCARENEKLQDAAVLDTTKYGKQTISKSSSLIHLTHIKQHSTDKDNSKLELKKRKAEDAVKKADVEYYTLCVRSERARLEWESAVLRGASIFQALEEERLINLKTVLTSYLHHNNYIGPRLIEASERLKGPVGQAEPTKDLSTFQNLRQSSQQVSEQLLPDFYCEHITLAMNRERRKQALVKLLQLIRQDMEREKKSKIGLENLSKAIKQTPSFGSEDSQQSVIEKLYHMKSMLTYLEGAKYKVTNSLAELESRPKTNHPLAAHITITRDKSGLQQSILKVPQWLKDEWGDPDRSPISQKSMKSNRSDNSDPHNNDVDDPDWLDRGAADGNSNQPDSDFDEFSSNCSSTGENLCTNEETPIHPIATCRAIYTYTPNMHDELLIKTGDVITVYRQQDDGWWLGECNGNVGIFPATYVELIQDC